MTTTMCTPRCCWVVLLAVLSGTAGASSAARVAAHGRDPPQHYNGTVMLGLDAQSLSEFLVFGLDAITTIIQIFEEDTEDTERIFNESSRKLWKLVQKVVPTKFHDTDMMRAAKEEWDNAFAHAPDITQELSDFRTGGNTTKLIFAVRAIISTAFDGCSQIFPDEAKYFQALSDLIGGIGESWSVFSDGSASTAVHVIWDTLKISIDDVFPEYADSIELYKQLMGKLDGVVSKLSQHVLEYKRRVLSSRVCYKQAEHRDRVRPSRCREGFEWDQGSLCFPVGNGHGADCYGPCGQAGMCDSFCGEGRACCRQGDASPAECAGASGFVDYAFTFGTSREYHQCSDPGPNVAFTIKGAGVPAVNGLYLQSGSHRGRPRYTNINSRKTIMEWSGKREAWRLYIDDTLLHHGRPTLYLSKQATETFPTEGWTIEEEGVLPVPTISHFRPPEGGSLLEVNRSAASSGRRARGPKPNGAHEAACDMDSEYSEKHKDWCLKPCPAGFKPEGGMRCTQTCGGGFPADGRGLCGTTKEQLMLTMAEMASMVVGGAVEAYTLIDDMKGNGVQAETLSGTINVFIEMGKPFARPQCPVSDTPDAETPELE